MRLAAFMDAQPKAQNSAAERRSQLLASLSSSQWAELRRQAQRNSLGAGAAEDALQDGCLQFMRCYDGPPEAVMPWLSLVIKRCAWAISRRSRERSVHQHVVTTIDFADATESQLVAPDEGLGPAELAERAEALERRIELLGELKPDERTALILLGLGASYEEIGELRGWSRTKVNRCISEGRAAMRTKLAEGEGG